VADSWGAELHRDLIVAGTQVRKGSNGEDGYSGFTMRDPISADERPTELEALLVERGVTRVVVCGLATDYCVRGTVLDACRLGFDTTVLSEAVAAVELASGDGARALAEMVAAGARLA
jgi:nicotinamidase/pyrazinamidase